MDAAERSTIEERVQEAIRGTLGFRQFPEIGNSLPFWRAVECGFEIRKVDDEHYDFVLIADKLDEVERCIKDAKIDPVAWDALRLIVKAFLKRNEALPSAVSAWNLNELNNSQGRPSKPPKYRLAKNR